MLREARILTALADTPVPVARVHGVCSDESVIGTPFFRDGDGRGAHLLGRDLCRDRTGRAPAYFDAMNATIAALHRIDPEAVGLGDYGAGQLFRAADRPLVRAVSG